jgi:hypothetical protein
VIVRKETLEKLNTQYCLDRQGQICRIKLMHIPNMEYAQIKTAEVLNSILRLVGWPTREGIDDFREACDCFWHFDGYSREIRMGHKYWNKQMLDQFLAHFEIYCKAYRIPFVVE